MASILCVIRIFEVASAWRINSSSAFLGGLRKIAPAVNVLIDNLTSDIHMTFTLMGVGG